MNPILNSLLCGAAFIGGAVAVTTCLAFLAQTLKQKDAEQGWKNMAEMNRHRAEQVEVLRETNELLRLIASKIK